MPDLIIDLPADLQAYDVETLLAWFSDPRTCPDERIRVLMRTEARAALLELRRLHADHGEVIA